MKSKNRYDSLIGYYIKEYNLDFNLVKALIETESSFNPNAISPAGARGLCQFMPKTWKQYGEGDIFNPEEQIKACCKYLIFLYGRFGEIPDLKERWKFALASYNAGRGNINKALASARESEGFPYSYREWVGAGSNNGKWQKWDYTKEFLRKHTGNNSMETINYIVKIENFGGFKCLNGE